jgi:hypothetical protein
MHKIKDYKKYKLNFSELKPILIQMGVFNNLKGKKIVFNPHPFSNLKIKKGKHVDLHLEVTKKIDQVIAHNKEEPTIDENRLSAPKFIEVRETASRTPAIPTFQSDLGPKNSFGELDNVQEFFEIEPPANFSIEKMPENKEDFGSLMINNQNEQEIKTYWGFGRIRIRTKDKVPEKTQTTQTNKNIETTIAKIELEETKKEIERKKKELDEAIKKEKEKELQVKKEEEEKRKLEKLKKLELKKKLKEEKINEKLGKKLQKETEILLKKQKIELKKQEIIKGKQPEETAAPEIKAPTYNFDIPEAKREYSPDNLNLDEDVAKLLPIIDSLFEKLPEEVVDEFTKSEYFELYEKVLLKYKNK